ncbi:hypothetical protein EJ08DRAFT_699265 [Tothia fuscella]|uniref:2EXR domain-containing protein n=1 Tax=Tothia fuscella TaxID=1048955 RepID=A0A9P4TVQ3_9PEZI|nr:hypothetical protein EJ08DRAFT_699265 [Tothia fuscella]
MNCYRAFADHFLGKGIGIMYPRPPIISTSFFKRFGDPFEPHKSNESQEQGITFHQFSNLPVEIQLVIWEYAAFNTRCISMTHELLPSRGHEAPAALLACKASYKAARKYYGPLVLPGDGKYMRSTMYSSSGWKSARKQYEKGDKYILINPYSDFILSGRADDPFPWPICGGGPTTEFTRVEDTRYAWCIRCPESFPLTPSPFTEAMVMEIHPDGGNMFCLASPLAGYGHLVEKNGVMEEQCNRGTAGKHSVAWCFRNGAWMGSLGGEENLELKYINNWLKLVNGRPTTHG